MMTINGNGIPKRCENVASIMQQVQSCPWNPFKLSEIVILEKCLQEVTSNDSNLGLILKKLTNESVFVEPERKLKYLARKDDEKRADIDLMKQARLIREEIKHINEEIEYYESKLNVLKEHEHSTKLQINQLKKAITSIESNCEVSHYQFELTLERVAKSFERSLYTIKVKIPDFIQSLSESQLLKQLDSLPSLYRTYLIDLIKTSEHYQQQPQLATQLSFCMKKNTKNRLNSYMKAIACLYRDLDQIDKIYTTEIPEEINFLETWKTHINYLEEQVQVPPKKITVIHTDPTPIEQKPLTCGIPDDTDDGQELCDLFITVNEKLKEVKAPNWLN